ncbi:MAG TPA: chemotaxis protein [Rhodopila sp.]|nr:chemotaxis protein [Rhodopila sp.]
MSPGLQGGSQTLARRDLDGLARALRSVSISMEARFLEVGNHLTEATGTIETLTGTFDRLAGDLRGDALREATQRLTQVMTEVAAMARGQDDTGVSFNRLKALVTTVQQHVANIAKSVHGISILAINARIEAVTIKDASVDFVGFTAQIARTLDVAKAKLDEFTQELDQVGGQLRTAHTSRIALAQRQTAAIRSIPGRLAAGIDAITGRGRCATAAASTVARKYRDVAQRIGSAVMALQIGDTTRQRLEHVGFALTVLSDLLYPGGTGLVDWTGLTAPQRASLGALGCRLQAEQLQDTASQFASEMRTLVSSFQSLANDTQEIRCLGDTAAGASDDRRDTFLAEVEGQIAEVRALVDELATANHLADDMAVSVTGAAERLVGYTGTLRLLEEDIRLMGLNTTLRCGRIGASGRPLIAIAQELRLYARQIATESAAVAACLDTIITIAATFRGDARTGEPARLATISQSMTRSAEQLQDTGRGLAEALLALERDSDGVAGLLRKTIGCTDAHGDLGQVLTQAIATLRSAGSGQVAADTDEATRMLALFAGRYTMDRERAVHDRCSGAPALSGSHPAAADVAQADMLEDCLF